MTKGVRVHRPSACVVAAALVGVLACDLTPAPRAMREPDSTDVDDPSALMSEPHHAEGALAEVTFSVKGKVADRYRQALERALLRAGMKVAEEGQTADLELELAVDADAESVPLPSDSSDEEIDKEFERVLAKLSITRGGEPVATIESTPKFELRTVTASGKVLGTKNTLDQVDIEFCGAGMNGLVTKLVHSAAVNEAATAIRAARGASAPSPSASASAASSASSAGATP